MKRSEKAEKHKRLNRLGTFLHKLREARKVSVREVSQEVGISAPYLFQVEFGKRALTDPVMFNKLAAYYGIPVTELLKLAGYITEEENREEELDKRFNRAIHDPRFKYGAKLRRKTDVNAMRFIVELYENLRMHQ